MADPTTEAEIEETAKPAADDSREAAAEAPVDDEADFGDAFAERSANAEADLEDGSDNSAAQADDDAQNKAGEQPAPDKAAEASAAAKEGTAPADPFDDLTPEQMRDKLKDYRHADASNRGRISSLTKKLNETAAQPAPSPTPAKAQSPGESSSEEKPAAIAAEDLQERMDRAIEDYPDVAGPFAEALTGIRADMDKLGNQVAPIADAKDEATLTQAHIDLEKLHPDYRELAGDESYLNWIAAQPEGIQALANSYDVKEVSSTLSLFKTERAAEMARLNADNPAEGETEVTETDTKRARQLDGNKAVKGSNQPASSATPNDFDAAFSKRAKQKAEA